MVFLKHIFLFLQMFVQSELGRYILLIVSFLCVKGPDSLVNNECMDGICACRFHYYFSRGDIAHYLSFQGFTSTRLGLCCVLPKDPPTIAKSKMVLKIHNENTTCLVVMHYLHTFKPLVLQHNLPTPGKTMYMSKFKVFSN